MIVNNLLNEHAQIATETEIISRSVSAVGRCETFPQGATCVKK